MSINIKIVAILLCGCLAWNLGNVTPAQAQGEWEITKESEQALNLGLQWLAENQGKEGNWRSKDLGVVATGALAFMAAGHRPGRGKYGKNVKLALDYVISNANPKTGLLNISNSRRGMYNHGLATFVLGQAHGMSDDKRLNKTLDRALKLIANTQCEDGGWDYFAKRRPNGHDLSLAVMQAKALRSAVDSGLEVPQEVIALALKNVRQHYTPRGSSRSAPEAEQKKHPGQFTYTKGGGGATVAMAAAGVVCLQEFGQYDDWRIAKSMTPITEKIKKLKAVKNTGRLPLDAYSLYYVGQALYQVGGKDWKTNYPILRDHLVKTQRKSLNNKTIHGKWSPGSHISGKEGDMYGTAVGCFILAIPNRYLPILQQGAKNKKDKK